MKKAIGAALIVITLLMLATACASGPSGRPRGPQAQYFLATGRWNNNLIVIDLLKAIDPANDGTDNAVVNRLRVTADIDPNNTGQLEEASGQPIYVITHPGLRRAYVTNHSGNASAASAGSAELGWPVGYSGLSSFGQHGQRGTVTVLDLDKALDPANWGTLGAVVEIFDSGGYGPTGIAIAPDGKYMALTHAEASGSEDGGYHIEIVDLATNKIMHRVQMAFGREPTPECWLARGAPNPGFGTFPCPNGMTFSTVGGGVTLFTANGGTLDVSVIDWNKAMARDRLFPANGQIVTGAELGRVPTQSGGFGISTSPCGRYVVVASREDPVDEAEDNTVSIIDVQRARTDPANAEIRRILVGSDDPNRPARPFAAHFTPDGKQIISTNFRTNNITVFDAEDAINGRPVTTRHIPLETPDGRNSRPRHVAFSADGNYIAITGMQPKLESNSGVVWILDTRDWSVKGRVTGIGNEAYLIADFTGPVIASR